MQPPDNKVKPMINFQEFKPPDHLEKFVRRFWILETAHKKNLTTLRIVADGCPGLIFQDNGNRLSFDKQQHTRLPALFLYGQSTQYGNLYSTGHHRIMGVQFHPYLLKSVFGFNANEITNEVLDVNLAEPGLADLLEGAKTTDNKFGILSGFITKQVERVSAIDLSVQQSVASIGRSNGKISLRKLHKTLQLSERQFERRFKQHTGITPILFSRITRFKSAFNQVRTGNYQKLSDVAFDNHYSDQSHFIREFKEFSGFKPGNYHSDAKEIIEICRN